jgi:hypothetical protein
VAGSLFLFFRGIEVGPSLNIWSGVSRDGSTIHCFKNGLFCRDPDGSPTVGALVADWATDEYDELLSSVMWQGSGVDVIEGDPGVKLGKMSCNWYDEVGYSADPAE